MAFREFLYGLVQSGPAVTAVGSVFGTGSYIMYKDRKRYEKMSTTFAKGNILPPMADSQYEIEYLPRPDVEKRLLRALTPNFTNEYYLISGEVGSGKTRTIVEMVRRMMSESGAEGIGAPIYVLTTQGKSFSESLAAAVNFNFDEHLSFKFFVDYVMRIHSFPQRDDHHRLTRVLEAVEKSAFEYMKENGRPAVIVIDGVNSLVKHMPAGLERLQEKAKLWADTNIVKLVFVFNDENTELFMQGHQSSWSRAASPIHICDFSEEEVVQFLTSPKLRESGNEQPCKFNMDEAQEIFQLVGGRVHHLVAFKRDRNLGKTLEETAEMLKNKEREKFVGVSKSSRIHKTMHMLRCSCHKGVSLAKLTEATSEEHMANLLKANIIKIERHGSGMVANFESKLTESIAKALGKE